MSYTARLCWTPDNRHFNLDFRLIRHFQALTFRSLHSNSTVRGSWSWSPDGERTHSAGVDSARAESTVSGITDTELTPPARQTVPITLAWQAGVQHVCDGPPEATPEEDAGFSRSKEQAAPR